jgi:CRP-like cAMP-binding protein
MVTTGRLVAPVEPHGTERSPDVERNWLLGALSAAEHAELAPHLVTVTLTASQQLGPPHEDIPLVYFPQSGVVSILKTMQDGTKVEVGTVGSEGMTALAVFLGGDEMPTECVVQIAGTAKRIHAHQLREASRAGGPLRDVLLCYTQYLISQMGQSVACSTLHSLEQRCARWLLMTRDRVGTETFVMTHDHLANLLGVRRAGVSEVAEELRRAGGIEYTRGSIRIIDPAVIEAIACECYRATSEDFARLLGKAGRRVDAIPGAAVA